MKTRNLQKQETRQNILDAAYSRFGTNGILATRMQDVADAAGVSHGTVFLHFKSQGELITAVIEDFGRKAACRTHELAAGRKGVRAVLEAHLQTIEESEDFYSRLIVELNQLPAACRNHLLMIQSALSLHLSEAATSEMQEGGILQMPQHLLFNTWMGLVQYYLMNRELFAPGESVIRRHGSELLDYFMSLIGKED